MVEVNQADREAAASSYFAWIGSNPVIPAKMRSGNADDHSMVQAFARARTEATAELVEALQGAVALIEELIPDEAPKSLVEWEALIAKHLTDGPGLTERLERS